MNKDKLKKILSGISSLDSGIGEAFKSVEKEMKKVADKLKEEAEQKATDQYKKSIYGLRVELKEEIEKSLQFILDTLQPLKSELKALTSLKTTLVEFETANSENIKNLKEDIREISERKYRIPDFNSQIQKIELELKSVITALKEKGEKQLEEQSSEFKEKINKLDKDIQELRGGMLNALSRGGSVNRQINVNSSVMSIRYTDINFQQFGNIGWTAVNDDDLKRVNIRASLLAGGGGGGGITRTVSVLSVSSTLAAIATTDYVLFPNVGIRLTLPTAISNTNLYTVKNMATSSVLVAASTGEDIDGSTTVLMPTQYEALNFNSNGSVWGVI